mmetsp:Transcript_32566/g.49829  ORF Transcript_32566/g.49829 Transcript_32566/m.49829 type:complete len:212 (-) Transcript_32566:335-970(-)
MTRFRCVWTKTTTFSVSLRLDQKTTFFSPSTNDTGSILEQGIVIGWSMRKFQITNTRVQHNPFVFQCFLDRNSFLVIRLEHFLDQIDSFIRYILPIILCKFNVTTLVGRHQFTFRFPIKWFVSTKHDKERHAGRKNIHQFGGISAITIKNFWCNESSRATTSLECSIQFKKRRHSKITQFDVVVVFIHENIGKFHIAVCNITLLHRFQAFE